jgi:hypothetical protein
MYVRDDVSVSIIKFCLWDEEARSIDAEMLGQFLCVLCSYRQLQRKLQVRKRSMSSKGLCPFHLFLLDLFIFKNVIETVTLT